jgi:hypothetical protein
MNETNSTTNAILVILLVVVVGFIVWFIVDRRGAPTTNTQSGPGLEINLQGGDSGGNQGAGN